MNTFNDKYIPCFDGIRGYSIILVILAHLGLGEIIPGGMGVSLFFFISGFLITKLLIKEYSEINRIDIKNFYLRRIVRLYPALVFMIGISIILMVIIKCPIHPPDVFAAVFYFTNYYDLYFKHSQIGDCNIFHILWSLSIEEHFYLFFPIIFYGLYNKKNILLKVLITVSIITLLIRCYLLLTSNDIERTTIVIYNATHTRADSIIWGCVAALLIYKNCQEEYLKFLKSNWSLAIGVCMILFSLLLRNVLFRESMRYTIQALAFLIIVPFISFNIHKPVLRMIFENKPIIFIGKLSYSLYLFHWVALTWASSYFHRPSIKWIVFMMFFTVVLSLSSYYFVERPFIFLRKRLGSNVN